MGATCNGCGCDQTRQVDINETYKLPESALSMINSRREEAKSNLKSSRSIARIGSRRTQLQNPHYGPQKINLDT